jgi:hypothetical protein
MTNLEKSVSFRTETTINVLQKPGECHTSIQDQLKRANEEISSLKY